MRRYTLQLAVLVLLAVLIGCGNNNQPESSVSLGLGECGLQSTADGSDADIFGRDKNGVEAYCGTFNGSATCMGGQCGFVAESDNGSVKLALTVGNSDVNPLTDSRGPCVPLTLVKCGDENTVLSSGQPYTDRWICAWASKDEFGWVHTSAESIPCQVGTKCENTGEFPNLGICATVVQCATDAQCPNMSQCTKSSCVAGACQTIPLTGATCDDSNKCTLDDICQAKGPTDLTLVCKGAPKDCDDDKECTVDSCNTDTGDCQYVAVNNGTTCDDDISCTVNDTCTDGTCAGTVKVCNDENECTTDACDPLTGACAFTAVADGTVCANNGRCVTECVPGGEWCVAGDPPDCLLTDMAGGDFISGVGECVAGVGAVYGTYEMTTVCGLYSAGKYCEFNAQNIPTCYPLATSSYCTDVSVEKVGACTNPQDLAILLYQDNLDALVNDAQAYIIANLTCIDKECLWLVARAYLTDELGVSGTCTDEFEDIFGAAYDTCLGKVLGPQAELKACMWQVWNTEGSALMNKTGSVKCMDAYAPGCSKDDECIPGYQCVFGACTEPECWVDEDCATDNNVCTVDACDNHKCVHAPIENCCTADEDCDDGDANTADSCEEANKCVHTPVIPTPECTKNEDCGTNRVCYLEKCYSDLKGDVWPGVSGAFGGAGPDGTPDSVDNDGDCYAEGVWSGNTLVLGVVYTSVNPYCVTVLTGDCDDDPVDGFGGQSRACDSGTALMFVAASQECPAGTSPLFLTDGSIGNNPGVSEFVGDLVDNNCDGTVQ